MEWRFSIMPLRSVEMWGVGLPIFTWAGILLGSLGCGVGVGVGALGCLGLYSSYRDVLVEWMGVIGFDSS
jgi:hypothetical protein